MYINLKFGLTQFGSISGIKIKNQINLIEFIENKRKSHKTKFNRFFNFIFSLA